MDARPAGNLEVEYKGAVRRLAEERTDKSALERILLEGAHGSPEFMEAQRALFLGELEERVLASLTRSQVEEAGVDAKVAAAAADPRAAGMIIHGDVPFEAAQKYRRLAEENGLPVTIRVDPSFHGEVGLVVISDEAV